MSWDTDVAGPDCEPPPTRHDPALAVVTFPMKDRSYPDDRPQWFKVEPPTAPPFCWSRNGSYVHRVRWTTLYPNWPGRPRLSAHTWCGTGAVHTQMHDHPDPDRTICGTCHGRAIGAGQIDHEGTPLIFTPWTDGNLGRCVYVTTSYHFAGGSDTHQCRSNAKVPIPEVPGTGVCRQHSLSWPPRLRWKLEDALTVARAQQLAKLDTWRAYAFGLLRGADVDPMDFWS